MTKCKTPQFDAQKFKRCLLSIARQIGERKSISELAWYRLVLRCARRHRLDA